MTQSNAIFAGLAIAFLVFITVRGELRTYMGFLLGAGSPGTTPTPASGFPIPNTAATQKAGNYIGTAVKIIGAF